MGIPTKIVAQGEDIKTLIPQREPIIMIDKMYEPDGDCSITGLQILDTNVFCENGKLQEAGIIENIAQSAAARIGYFCKMNNTIPPVGFIGSVKDLIINELPSVGQELLTEIKLLHEVMECSIIAGKVTCNGLVVAECEMKVFVQKTSE